METGFVSNEGSRIEWLEIKGIIIKYPPGFRIGCEQDLEATVKQKSFNLVCSDSPSDPIRSL
jgi:hypothetical protein